MSFIPNTTPTPNWLYNGEMKKMNETELKVVLLVTRKTLGWFDPMTQDRKTQDYISQSQFIEFTGQSNRAIATAIQKCVNNGWIIAKDREGKLCNTPESRARRKVWYQLGNIFTSKISGEESSQDDKKGKNLVNKTTKSGEQNSTNLVKNVHSTKETITKEIIQNTAETSSADIVGVIDSFQKVNPSYKKWYGNTTQRAAISRLIEIHGLHQLLSVIALLPKTNRTSYLPTITTPLQLEDKWASLEAGLIKKKLDFNRNKIVSL